MTSIDTSDFQRLLQEERERLANAVAHLQRDHPGSMEDELGEISGGGTGDNHLADMATVTYDRELDEGLEEGVQQTVEQIDARSRAHRRRHIRPVRDLRQADRAERLPGDRVDDPVHRRREALSESPKPQRPAADVRVGSSTDGLAPISVVERSLAAGPWQWAGLAAVAAAAIVADQVTKHVVTSSCRSTSPFT